MKFLAIDYGTKRVGVAINHEWLAEPYAIFDRAVAMQNIADVVVKEHVDALVLGVSDGPMAQEARKFGAEVSVATGLQIIEADETLTSVETHAKLVHSSMPRNRRQQPIDHYAAAAILQDYLDTHQQKSE